MWIFDNHSFHRFWLIHPCDGRTDERTQTELRWLRRATVVAAVARKTGWRSVFSVYKEKSRAVGPIGRCWSLFLRDASRVLAMAWASVRPSVCLSVTLLYSVKRGASQDHEIFTASCLKVSSFSWQNFVPLGEGLSLERGRQIGVPP